MLEFKDALQRLESSEEFKSYKISNPEAYLTTVVYLEKINFNYFSPNTKKITIFKISDSVESETLDEEDREFNKLDIDKIKLDINQTKEIFEKEKKHHYTSEQPTKTIFILQQNSEPTWNISELTSAIKILQILISASSGKVLESSYKPIMEMQ